MDSITETPVSITITTDETPNDLTAKGYLERALAAACRYQRLSEYVKFCDVNIFKNFDRVTITATAVLTYHECRLVDEEGTVATIPVPLTDTIIINGATWVPRFPDYENGVVVYSAKEEASS